MVRRYDPDRPVPSAVLEEVLAAALRAPSAGDTQGVSLLVLREPAGIETYWAATTVAGEPDRWLQGMRTAPALVLVWTSELAYRDRYTEPDKGWVERGTDRWSAPYWYVDAGMASMAALLAAEDAELGACFFGVPPGAVEAVRAAFGVPAEQSSVGVISLGYPPSQGSRPAPRRRPKRLNRVHLDRWGEQ